MKSRIRWLLGLVTISCLLAAVVASVLHSESVSIFSIVCAVAFGLFLLVRADSTIQSHTRRLLVSVTLWCLLGFILAQVSGAEVLAFFLGIAGGITFALWMFVEPELPKEPDDEASPMDDMDEIQ